MPLSPAGHEQARETGRQLKALIGDEPLYIYTSPYKRQVSLSLFHPPTYLVNKSTYPFTHPHIYRTKQTLANILESFEDNVKVGIREEPRITEQQFGNFQCHELVQQAKKDRAKFGRFYFRYVGG